jgi:adenine-specific DNA-methyltransferase
MNISEVSTNYYLTATGARILRKDIKERSIIKNLINFNEFKIFESALGQHNMITILKKAKNENDYSENLIIQNQGIATPEVLRQIFDKTNKETIYSKVAQKDLYDGNEYYIRLAGKSDNSTNPLQTILQKLEKQGELLGTICNVNQGIVTGANKVTEKHISSLRLDADPGDGIFVLSPKELKEKRISIESEHIKKWYKNSDIKKYWTNTSEKEYVLYFKDKKKKQYIEKEILEHFKDFKELLIERLSVCKKNKFQWNIVSKWIERGEYYLLFYPRKQEIFDSPKIVAPQRSPRNVFGYNEITWCAASDVYFITQLDSSISLKYVLAILNSKLVYLWLYHRGKRKGENLELFVKPLSEIPIKRISVDEQKPIIKLVDRILATKRTNSQADICKVEEEIDQIVYKLYGLTKEEIAIVEGKG